MSRCRVATRLPACAEYWQSPERAHGQEPLKQKRPVTVSSAGRFRGDCEGSDRVPDYGSDGPFLLVIFRTFAVAFHGDGIYCSTGPTQTVNESSAEFENIRTQPLNMTTLGEFEKELSTGSR